jgi:hypothetical protein
VKRKLLIAALAAFTAFLCCVIYLGWPLFTVGQLRERYAQTQSGMSVAQVKALMARTEDDWRLTPPAEYGMTFWDEDRLSEEETKRITSAIRYTVPTFFMPVIFEFTFDAEGRLVGRHIYD